MITHMLIALAALAFSPATQVDTATAASEPQAATRSPAFLGADGLGVRSAFGQTAPVPIERFTRRAGSVTPPADSSSYASRNIASVLSTGQKACSANEAEFCSTIQGTEKCSVVEDDGAVTGSCSVLSGGGHCSANDGQEKCSVVGVGTGNPTASGSCSVLDGGGDGSCSAWQGDGENPSACSVLAKGQGSCSVVDSGTCSTFAGDPSGIAKCSSFGNFDNCSTTSSSGECSSSVGGSAQHLCSAIRQGTCSAMAAGSFCSALEAGALGCSAKGHPGTFCSVEAGSAASCTADAGGTQACSTIDPSTDFSGSGQCSVLQPGGQVIAPLLVVLPNGDESSSCTGWRL